MRALTLLFAVVILIPALLVSAGIAAALGHVALPFARLQSACAHLIEAAVQGAQKQ